MRAELKDGFSFWKNFMDDLRRRGGGILGAAQYDGWLGDFAQVELPSLNSTARYFGLDARNPQHCAVLLRILIDVACEKQRAGRRKGSATYDNLDLALKYETIKSAMPEASDSEIAKVLHKRHGGSSVEAIRQRLPKAKRALSAKRRQMTLPVIGLAATTPVLGL